MRSSRISASSGLSERRVDPQPLHLALAGHDDRDQAAAGTALDLERRHLLLQGLHLLLQFLGLLHHAHQVAKRHDQSSSSVVVVGVSGSGAVVAAAGPAAALPRTRTSTISAPGKRLEHGGDQRIGAGVVDQPVLGALPRLGDGRAAAVAGDRDHPARAGPFLELLRQFAGKAGRGMLGERDLDPARLEADDAHAGLELVLQLQLAIAAGERHHIGEGSRPARVGAALRLRRRRRWRAGDRAGGARGGHGCPRRKAVALRPGAGDGAAIALQACAAPRPASAGRRRGPGAR